MRRLSGMFKEILYSPTIFRNIINYLAISTIFMEAFTYNFSFHYGFKIYNFVLLFIIILLSYPLRGIYFNKTFLILFSIIIFYSSILNVVLHNSSIDRFIVQIVGISIHSLAFYLLINFNNKDLKKIFLIYLNIAFFVALIGILQEIGFLFVTYSGYFKEGIGGRYSFLYDLRSYFHITNWEFTVNNNGLLRLNSILPEATSFCATMLPALFAALASLTKNNFKFISVPKSLVIIISFLLTFSTIGYIAFICAIWILLLNGLKSRYKIILSCCIAVLLLLFSYFINQEFKLRINHTYGVLTGNIKFETANQSTYTLLRNALVTYNVFKESPLFGMGLGSHEISYNKYSEKMRVPEPISAAILNKKDANSLFFRLFSETGLIGIVIVFVFIFMYFIPKSSNKTAYLWVINNGIFILFLLRLMRQGNYISEGFFFFIWMYYFSKKIALEADDK